MHSIQLSQNVIIVVSLITQASRNIWKLGSGKENQKRKCAQLKCAVISNYVYCWKHSEVWLVWFRVRDSFSGPESRLEEARQQGYWETDIPKQVVRHIGTGTTIESHLNSNGSS